MGLLPPSPPPANYLPRDFAGDITFSDSNTTIGPILLFQRTPACVIDADLGELLCAVVMKTPIDVPLTFRNDGR